MNDIFYWLEGLDDLSYNKVKEYIINLNQDLASYVDIVLYQRKIIDNLQQENKILNENNQNMKEEMCRCWQRIDKTIKLINKRKNEVDELLWVEMRAKDYFEECDEIINTLQNGVKKK